MDVHKKTKKHFKKKLTDKKSPTKSSPAISVESLKKTVTLENFDHLEQLINQNKEIYTKKFNRNMMSAQMKTEKSKPIPDNSSEIVEELFEKPNSVLESHNHGFSKIEQAYPLLTDTKLISKFMAVPMTNNQKGRIRQLIREDLKSNYQESDNGYFNPRILNQKIQAIISKREELTESDLRKIRILHNMLRFSTQSSSLVKLVPKKNKNRNKKKKMQDKNEMSNDPSEMPTSELPSNLAMIVDDERAVLETNKEDKRKVDANADVEKVKGPKRYVVFLGNLPYLTDKEKIMQHFIDIKDDIKDIRIPKMDNKRGGIAYLELNSESGYQMALSKHHSMMQNRRINVLYTTTSKKKMEMSEVKGKTAKLLALQKSGRLLGSIPESKKRSFRRKKQRNASATGRPV